LPRLKICNASPTPSIRQNWDCDRAFGVAQTMVGPR
jgi:hypothetical protein